MNDDDDTFLESLSFRYDGAFIIHTQDNPKCIEECIQNTVQQSQLKYKTVNSTKEKVIIAPFS